MLHDKENFGDKMQDFIQSIIDEAQDSDLCRYNWKLHIPLVEETINQHEIFHDFFIITFITA